MTGLQAFKIAPPFQGWDQPPAPGELRLVPIGGLGEFGMNALAVHCAEGLVLIDCGQLFPSDDQPGIDRIVPDFAYLEPFTDQVLAVLLTHGHEDHIGALPYFLRRWPVPVYGTAFTLGLVAGKCREHDIPTEGMLREVHDFDRRTVGPFEAEWIPVTHSIPDACAIALRTPSGTIVHSGDFKLDAHPTDGRLTGIARLQALGQAGVRMLLSDSTNVMQLGETPSESICAAGLRDALQQTKGRLVVATFSSNIHRMQTLVDLAYAAGRSVCLVGRSVERNIELARSLGRFKLPDDILVKPADAHHYEPQELLLICTGSQGEPQSGLMRILRGEVKNLALGVGDRLILSARPIPGNEVGVSRMLDAAARLGVETSVDGIGPIHATGHGHRPDLKTLIETLRPDHMVPVHGTFRNLQAHGAMARQAGWAMDHIHLLDGGTCLVLAQDGSVRNSGQVPVGRCFIDEGVEHSVDARVVHDRLILQEDGVIFATLMLDAEDERVGEPSILSRGFVMLSDDEAYGDLLAATLTKAFDETPRAIRKDREAMKELLRQSLRRVIRKTTQTRPLVVPVLLDAPAES